MDERQLPMELVERMKADTVSLREDFFRYAETLSAQQVAEKAGLAPEDANRMLRAWRAEKRVFAVENNEHVFYPAFQFDQHAQPLRIIGEILAILGQVASRSDWDNAFWFIGANGWLSGKAPYQMLKDEPAKVLKAAKQEVLPDVE